MGKHDTEELSMAQAAQQGPGELQVRRSERPSPDNAADGPVSAAC